MITSQNNNYSINNKLCQQCGACISICNRKAISPQIDSKTGLMVLNINPQKCIKCGLCLKICPAANSSFINNLEAYSKEKYFFLGYNSSDDIRSKSSSGGIARTIIIEGLKNNIFDGVYTLKKTSSYPFAEGYLYTKENIPSYFDIPNSIYHSVPLNINMNKISKCNRILIVGTSCQLYALKKYLKHRCNEIYSLCIFCKQQKTFESTKFIAKLAGAKLNNFNDLKSFSYRGNGWPGYCSFNNKMISYNIAAIFPFGQKLWTVPGCNICGNPFGDDVELTVLDPWNLEVNNKLGKSLIISHSKRGLNLLSRIPNINLVPKKYSEVKPSLMLEDIEKKIKLIPYFKDKRNNKKLILKGYIVERQRKVLQSLLIKLPKMPLIFYRILNKVLIDFR